ncbi:MAG: L-threonylcarbamoyladenylate synthase [Novosphingobium sp.]
MADNSDPRIRVADAPGIADAAKLLRGGGLVAVPTETVYGLAARADSEAAVAAIFRAKGRPDFNPLIVHVAGVDQAEALAQFDLRARALAEAFWPGPLTMALPLRSDSGLAPAVTAGLPTVALRAPAHPAMRALMLATRLPIAAPSANRSGTVSPTTAAHVAASLPRGPGLILDAGPSAGGIESTIVALREGGGWDILRPGLVSAKAIAAVIGAAPQHPRSEQGIEAPGQLARHYAPGKPLRLDAQSARPDEFMIGFALVQGRVNLSPDGDLAEAAARLYAALHLAAASPLARIAVAPIPSNGIGEAINDRLRRAAMAE